MVVQIDTENSILGVVPCTPKKYLNVHHVSISTNKNHAKTTGKKKKKDKMLNLLNTW
jgi:hypothetical protein